MKKIIIAIIGLAIILLAAVFIIPSLVPSSVYKDKIQAQLSQELGRDIRINGDVKLSTFPVVKAKTGSIEIDNPEGFSRKEFVSLEGLEARVKLLPLLSKRVEISRFTLEQPRIHLERRADGRANWELNDDPNPTSTEEAAPFSRDGTLLTTFEPAINAFELENGLVTYVDAVAGQNVEVSEINTAVSLPGLASTFAVDGDFTYDGTPITLDLNLNSPRAFLDGQEASIKGNVKTSFANLNIDGNFLASEAIDLAANVDGDITDMAALGPFLGENAKYIDPLNTTKVSGDIRFVDGAISATNTKLAVRGDSLTVDFDGDVDLTDAPIVNGTLAADITDLSIVRPFLTEDIKGLDSIKTVNIQADMTAADKGFTAKTLTAKVTGPDLSADFNGSAAYGEVITASGRATANILNPVNLAAIFAPDLAAAKVLGATEFTGDITYEGDNISAKNVKLKTGGEYLSADFAGDFAKNGETINVTGNFNSDIPDLPRLVKTAEIDVKDINAVKAAKASGQVQTDGKTTRLSALDAALTGGLVNGTYKGDATVGETQSFDGSFSADIPDMNALDQAISTEIPYATAIGKITTSGQVKGTLPANAIEINALNAVLTGGQLNGSYTGSARYKDGLTMNGRLETNIPNLRALAATAGTELPPNTSAGQIFEAFALSGDVSGTPETMKLSNAKISLDKLNGTGIFGVDLTQTKPSLNGELNLAGLDLRPYMESYSSQPAAGGIQPWSEQPLNVEPLKAMDANFTLNSPNVKTGRIDLGQTTLKTTLRNGLLNIDVPTVNLYSGTGTFKTVLNANAAVPQVEMDFNLKRLASDTFLGAVAGFTQATGQADTKISFKGQGRTQSEIMKSLAGSGGFNMLNGSLQGIDTTEFLTGLDSALTSRSLPGGIGIGKITNFNDLVAGFSMENGVATIKSFTINGPQFTVEGGGSVDIGNQLIDFQFLPKPTGSRATGIAQYGIPLRFSGKFGSAKAGLDTNFLSKIVAAQAQQRATDLVKDQIGGSLGNVLGGVIGGNQASTSGATSGQAAPQSTEDAIGGIVGGLFGGGQSQPAQTPNEQTGTQPKAEPKLEEQIFDLFGKKKKKGK
ncbi:MAG: AsmA family protein [Litorimonas sp.]